MIYITNWTGFSGENWRPFSLLTDISEEDSQVQSELESRSDRNHHYIDFKNSLHFCSKRQVGTSLASAWTTNIRLRPFKDTLPSGLVSRHRHIYPSRLKMQAVNFFKYFYLSTKLPVIRSRKTVVLIILMMMIMMIHLRMWLFHDAVSC